MAWMGRLGRVASPVWNSASGNRADEEPRAQHAREDFIGVLCTCMVDVFYAGSNLSNLTVSPVSLFFGSIRPGDWGRK